MRAVVQRVARARVEVSGEETGAIAHGLLVYLGVGQDDSEADLAWMADKLVGLRIFYDESGKMARDVRDVSGSVLVVSQFTLYGDVKKGRRPSFTDAMAPDGAERLYEMFVRAVADRGVPVATGRFRADMQVESVNDGPVTMWLESPAPSARVEAPKASGSTQSPSALGGERARTDAGARGNRGPSDATPTTRTPAASRDGAPGANAHAAPEGLEAAR
jgi:D-tyrosyl-tRNA(Tyr) deacylase